MKKLLSLILALVMCFSMVSTVLAAEMKFEDVKETDWFYNDVKIAVESGLVNGKSETSYAPGDNLTYAEAIKLAACMNQLYTDGAITLKSGERITFKCTINSGEYLEYDGKTAYLYDYLGNKREVCEIEGKIEIEGEYKAHLTAESSDITVRGKVTFGFTGEELE